MKNILIACAVLAFVPFADEARACINETIAELDELAPRVAKAKKALEQGRYLEASKAVKDVMPEIQTRAEHYGDARALLRRAKLIGIAATIRSNGRVVGSKTFDDENARIARLLEAYQKLISLNAPKKESEQLEAEVMARSANLRAEAKTRLEELAKKDLLASAEAWAALAVLRADAGDTAGAAQAKERCAARAKTDTQCLGFRVEAPGRT